MADSNPLLSEDSRDWERLIESLGPASLLVAIEGRMSAELRARLSAEDLLQDTLLHLWRDRARIEWRGARAFRTLVLSMADNRIRDAADHEFALKRGGGHGLVSTDPFPSDGPRSSAGALPAASTTPSRVAIRREQADAMREALSGLPDELREIVRLRAFEQMPLEGIAERLGLGVEAVRHRFRKGSALYARRLRSMLDTGTSAPEFATDPRSNASS
ncbi:MAG: sigma-70 family RNA polymerase sigma factor [Planctomycetes bacterium]|nr:sigma-70 family RNA polymerase sigma factor [Planctomycetota bacterium]